jgi:nicotinamidase-related amidase
MRRLWRGVVAVAGALVTTFAAPSSATDIVDEWTNVSAPPVPELKAITLEGSTTALLILDMTKGGSCPERPRCLAAIPNVKRLHDAARAAGAMLWYSVGNDDDPAGVIDPGFTPREGEYFPQRGPDTFLGSNLEEKLKARGIQTVIVCGTSFQGVGVGTGSGAAQRGYRVIVPVDCLSSEDPYMEQYSSWHFYKGGPGAVVRNSTLTRSTMVTFAN